MFQFLTWGKSEKNVQLKQLSASAMTCHFRHYNHFYIYILTLYII